MKALALVALVSLAGCDPWWMDQSVGPSDAPTVTLKPGRTAPPVVITDTGPQAAPAADAQAYTQSTAEPTIAPVPTSEPQASVSAAPVPASTPIAAAALTSCESLKQVMVTSFGRQVCSYSEMFRGNTPFHHTLAELIAAGATVLPQQIVTNWWAGGRIAEKPYGGTPLYVGMPGQPTHTVTCNGYGFACDATGMALPLPPGAQIQSRAGGNMDSHLTVLVPATGVEVDLFGCQPSNITACVNGGAFPFSGSGMVVDQPISDEYSTGNAGGYALGLAVIAGGEWRAAAQSDTYIPHALMMAVSCTGNSPVWPSTHGADAFCPKYHLPMPNVEYGEVLGLRPDYAIPAGASPFCRSLLRTYQTMGVYVDDSSGGWGSAIATENPSVYSASNPWTAIEQTMDAAGESSGSGASFGFNSCFEYTTAADWRAYRLKAGDAALPPLSVAGPIGVANP